MPPSVKLSVPRVVRCFAEMKGEGWQAFSLEFGLAAQGESFEDVRDKLASMIQDYIFEAAGEDRKYAPELLARRAPVWVFYRYHRALLLHRLRLHLRTMRTFFQPVSLDLARCN